MSDGMGDGGGDVGGDTGGEAPEGGAEVEAVDAGTDEGGEDAPQDDAEAEAPEGEEPEGEGEDESAPLSPGMAKKLRAEAATLRARAKDYEAAFEGVPDDARGALLDSARLFSEDPQAWAEEMAGIVDQIRGGQEQAEPEAPGIDPDDDETPLTAKQMEAYLSKREATKEAERTQAEGLRVAQEQIASEMKELGYDSASKDPAAARRAKMVTYLALHETGGDLRKAHELLESDRRSAVKTVRDAKAAQAAGASKVVQGQPGTEAAKKLQFGSPEWKKQFASG